MDRTELSKEIQNILNDNTSGSSVISAQIEDVFPYIPEDIFQKTMGQFLSVHSSMASVINRINYLCLIKEGKPITGIKSYHEKTFKQFWAENQNSLKWITLSMSHWVIECLKHNQSRCEIKVGISYPDKEGLITYDLLKDYHNVKVYEDSRLGSEIRKADGIILGADLIGKKHIINKSGSLSLALAAKYFKKPLYILSSGDKILTEMLMPFYKMKKVKNQYGWTHYFEKVPLELVTKIYMTTEEYQFPLSNTLKEIGINSL